MHVGAWNIDGSPAFGSKLLMESPTNNVYKVTHVARAWSAPELTQLSHDLSLSLVVEVIALPLSQVADR